MYCIGESRERFMIEIQKAKQNYFKDRRIYYSSFPIQEQAQKGDWDYRLEPVYTVGILDLIFDDHKADEEILHIVELKNRRCEIFFEKLKFIYIELPKFTKKEQELETQFDKWLYVLRHLSHLPDRPQKLQDKIFERLFEVAEIAKFSSAEKEAYEESLKYYRDMKNVVDTSREEEIEEGREQGIEEKTIEFARTMKQHNEPIQKIMDYMGLSKSQIEEL